MCQKGNLFLQRVRHVSSIFGFKQWQLYVAAIHGILEQSLEALVADVLVCILRRRRWTVRSFEANIAQQPLMVGALADSCSMQGRRLSFSSAN